MLTLDFSGSGYFYTNNQDEKYHGNLYLNSEQGGIFLEIEIFHDGTPLSYLTLPLKVKYISGELTNGFKLTLMNCVRTNTHSYIGSRDTFTYAAEFMFEGIKIPQLKYDLFTQVDFVIPDVILWGGESSYKIEKDNFSLSKNLNDSSIVIYSDNQCSIEYAVFGTMLPVVQLSLLVEKITLTQKPIIIIKAQKPREFNYFLEKYKLIKRYIEIAMKKEINVVEIKSYPSKSILEENGFDYEFSIKVNSSLINVKNKTITKFSDRNSYLFSLRDLVEYGDFSSYVKNADKLEPVIDLYLDIIYSKEISAIRAFLNVTQALETYHSRFKYGGNIEGFKKRIDEVILKNRPESLNKNDKKFLLANSKGFVTLESRLAELLLAEFNIHFYTGKVDYIDFPNVIAKTRNYYTHYNEKQKMKIIKKENLTPYIQILLSILEYYLLEELGIKDVKFRRKKISDTLSNVIIGFDVRDADEKLNKNL